MSLILCIETGTNICSVGISRDGELVSLRESAEGRDHAKHVGVFVDELLRETGVMPDELDAVVPEKFMPDCYATLCLSVTYKIPKQWVGSSKTHIRTKKNKRCDPRKGCDFTFD